MDERDQKLLPPPPEHKQIEAPHAHEPGHKKISRWTIFAIAAALLLLLTIIFLAGYIPRRNRERTAAALAAQQARLLPVANVTKVRQSPRVSNLLLPGSITPLTETYIYARATGYVRKRYADMGDRVRENQLLAEIDAPDLDAQVSQARAQLAQSRQELAQARAALENAQAQEELARVTWERYRVLVEHGAVSRQEADQWRATYLSAQATVRLQEAAVSTAEENIRSFQANLEHLLALQVFEIVRAPFDGVVTARNFDVGALVSSTGQSLGASSTPQGGTQVLSGIGNSGINGLATSQSSGEISTSPTSPGIGTSGELYRIAQIGILRILVDVPQISAPGVQVGSPASIYLQEFAKRTFHGMVTRTASALDQTARTLPTEVQVVNREGLLLPGMYTQVQFSDTRPSPPLLVPGDAIITDADGLSVAVLLDPTPQQRQELQERLQEEPQQDLREAKRIHLQRVEVGRDYGPQIEVTNGLQGWEYLVVNPGDNIVEGALVIPRSAPNEVGQGSPERRGPSEQAPGSGIGSPSMQAPTGGTPQTKGGPGKGGSSSKGGKTGGGGK